MAEAQPSGLTKYNPEAADFVPREHLSHHSGWKNHGRTESNRNWSRNLPASHQQQPPRESNHDSPSQKVHSYNSSAASNQARGQHGSPEITNKPVKNHSFQNQRWHRSRSERSHNRNHSRQPLSDTPARTSFVATTPLGDWRVRTRDPNDLCSSESEKEFGSADSRGAKPKRLTHVSGGSLRGPRDRTKLAYDREKRVAPKQKTDELFENIPPQDFVKSGTLKEDHFKSRIDRCDGATENKQKHSVSFNKPSREPLDWKKTQDDVQTFKRNEAQSSKLSRHDKSQPATFPSKEKKTNRGTEPPLSNTYKEAKSRGHHWVSDGDKPAGRKHPSHDRASKSSVQPGFSRPSKKHDLPKSKETHTGSLIEQLTAEKYECMVCCEVVRVMAPVWSCQSCYHVFHLNCIKKWARSPASQAEEENSGWRCPACQNVCSRAPSIYTCFCSKVNNPEWSRNEIPHSCGELCGKKRSGLDCPHTCNILCHPGPCPSCPAFVTKTCECGRTSQSVRCGQSSTMHCANVCGNPLNCGEHNCNQVCHAGKCQPCQQVIHQACYCGGSSRDVSCGTDKDNYDGFGNFSCQKLCGKKLNCGKHGCTEVCHPQPCQPCPRLPQIVRFCPCGQTSLSKLLELGCVDRKICTDPIPSCGKTCGKPLPCGSHDFIHTCENLCHEGECGPCPRMSNISCRSSNRRYDLVKFEDLN
ncbi:transcriptional repressor NF-X1 [Bufo gargarizans]|uniref:transcriptional repressor NF-X1 n=1 Tax=Bufo gargarizans TaxID=30331 RepID=UPI001CF4A224|nr:transcriptional repressor NF-X1 [Bufo gargarizans]